LEQKSEDLRVMRTRKLIQKALIELAAEKGFASVTVRDITERAMVNRSTFYRHYLDKYDLLGKYLEEMFSLLDGQAEEESNANPQARASTELPAGLISLLRHIQANADFYRVMLSDKGEPAFCAQSFRKRIERGLHQMLPVAEGLPTPDSTPIDLIVNSVLHSGVGAILWWLENEQPISPEQMAVWLTRISKAIILLALETGVDEAAGERVRD
jgi:AcrR family transcriptional regulator